MKIIQITDHNGSGGVNSFVYDLCKAQRKKGNEVLFVGLMESSNPSLGELEELKNDGVEVICCRAHSKRDAILHDVKSLREIVRKFSKDKPCIVNLHLKLSVLVGVLACGRMKNVRIVETYHNTYHHYELQYTIMHPWIRHYIAISHTCGLEMKRRFHTKDSQMTVIPNGIDRSAIREVALNEPVKLHDGLLFMSVGRLSYEKNIKTPVEAMISLCNKSLRYRIIGDGPQMEEIKTAAKGSPFIEFTGQIPRENVLKELAQADLVIMPSLWEGRSILQLEAMALDKPLMLSDVPALREVFDEESLKENELYRICSWGYLVQTNNLQSYKAAALDFIKHHDKEGKGMAARIREASLQNDMKNVAEQYQKVYENVGKDI